MAGLSPEISSITPLGIGSAGLNARGNRDEDGTNARVVLVDGTSVIYREYADTNSMVSLYQEKEAAVFAALAAGGLPAPRVLAMAAGGVAPSEGPPATLLSDGGGEPLETVFREVPASERGTLWSEVGTVLRGLHDLDPASAPILREPVFQRPWTQFVPYFLKSLKSVGEVRPDLAPHVAALRSMRPELTAFVESRQAAMCCAFGYLPGMLVARAGSQWRCSSWLNLGYYVSLRDSDQDLMNVVVAHREWLGDEVPADFFLAYGARPDPLAEVLYEAQLQLSRGASYLRGKSRPGWGPPPHSGAVAALDELPETVERLRSLLA